MSNLPGRIRALEKSRMDSYQKDWCLFFNPVHWKINISVQFKAEDNLLIQSLWKIGGTNNDHTLVWFEPEIKR